MEDWWELLHFGDLDRDGTGDDDLDELTDAFEFAAGTNPLALDSDGITAQ